jgi:hypothetical protein
LNEAIGRSIRKILKAKILGDGADEKETRAPRRRRKKRPGFGDRMQGA